MILEIEDALGVAQDLNNYYNDIYDHLTQFKKEKQSTQFDFNGD
ncbi:MULTISPECIES: hypothetical protein [unclassified Gilliamella]|jgi:hypothetical protein|nr:hypothetical protein [Gilliamella apicola]KFA58846.1 hypothetical protein GAPWKB11_0735 [Gilliamella apicola]